VVSLDLDARQVLQSAGISRADYARSWFADGRWHGDTCGCPDDRCIGHHHDADEPCGCIRSIVDERKNAPGALQSTEGRDSHHEGEIMTTTVHPTIAEILSADVPEGSVYQLEPGHPFHIEIEPRITRRLAEIADAARVSTESKSAHSFGHLFDLTGERIFWDDPRAEACLAEMTATPESKRIYDGVQTLPNTVYRGQGFIFVSLGWYFADENFEVNGEEHVIFLNHDGLLIREKSAEDAFALKHPAIHIQKPDWADSVEIYDVDTDRDAATVAYTRSFEGGWVVMDASIKGVFVTYDKPSIHLDYRGPATPATLREIADALTSAADALESDD
jgi:hypothetical protein